MSPPCVRWRSLILHTSTKGLYSWERGSSFWWDNDCSTNCICLSASNIVFRHASPNAGPTGLHLYSLSPHPALPPEEWTSKEKHGSHTAGSKRKTRYPVPSKWKATFKWKESSKTHGWAMARKDEMCKMLRFIPRSWSSDTLGFPSHQIPMLWIGRSGQPPTQCIYFLPGNDQSTILHTAPLRHNSKPDT